MKIKPSSLSCFAFIFSLFLLAGISLSAQEIGISGMPTENNSTQDPPATVVTIETFKKHAGEAVYLNLSKIGDAVVNSLIIGKPPQPGTPAFDADDTNRLIVYTNATQQQIDQAKAAEYGFFSFASILGSNFKAEQLPQAAALFHQVDADLKLSTDAAKNTFRRHHPLRDGGFSYPSDHATNMFFYARLLTEIYPAQAKEFYQYASRLSVDRVMLGGHYPADIVAGEVYGFYLATEFLNNPSFQKKWNEVKSEITTLIPGASITPVQ